MYCFTKAKTDLIHQRGCGKLEFFPRFVSEGCFDPKCNDLPRVRYPECDECKKYGIDLRFCAEHISHHETHSKRSHKSMLSNLMTVSVFFRRNQIVCDELMINNEHDLAEAVEICYQERWSSGDLFGADFQAVQNRLKLHRHFLTLLHRSQNDYFKRERGNLNPVCLKDYIPVMLRLSKESALVSKCAILSCNVQHTNQICQSCNIIGMSRRYCDNHLEHLPNAGGIDHCAEFNASISVERMLEENLVLFNQLNFPVKASLKVYQNLTRKIINLCAKNGWLSGQLLGDLYTARIIRDAICIEIRVLQEMKELKIFHSKLDSKGDFF